MTTQLPPRPTVRQFLRDETAISAVEYAVLLGMIGAGLVVSLNALSGQIDNRFQIATTAITPGP